MSDARGRHHHIAAPRTHHNNPARTSGSGRLFASIEGRRISVRGLCLCRVMTVGIGHIVLARPDIDDLTQRIRQHAIRQAIACNNTRTNTEGIKQISHAAIISQPRFASCRCFGAVPVHRRCR
ncbi:hypothetical protein HMPREF3160_08960 [Arthrobacter sp. HMSC06H05]|uniref:Uncharacterized protein n=1 Tax=Pseudoglutamicibacter albus DNF00011 TaxID=1401063 RepID=A0A095YEH6_9MICC|nr:hypothetical protein HMPREF2128_04375 [Pseudoglutamicibacter albus DNF00011]OFT22924.1 hypothetical protein HMPREF3175_06990 [Arthrobacter sp. HMSC08H08]OFT40809.1 hypothetical protein HMPREF3160_08960 [Arthrobacter sp. HMSC06H05]